MVTKNPRKTRFKDFIVSKIRRSEKSRDKLLEKKHATMNSRSSALPTRTDILLSCGFTFLEFLDLWTLNSLYELGLKTRAFDPIRSGSLVYWKKRVRKYIEKTKQEVKFAYANIDFFKQENIPYSCRTFEKCASYNHKPGENGWDVNKLGNKYGSKKTNKNSIQRTYGSKKTNKNSVQRTYCFKN